MFYASKNIMDAPGFICMQNALKIINDFDHTEHYLRSVPQFANLSPETIACFRDAAQLRSYEKDRILYIQEEPAKSFYIVCIGWVRLFHTLPEGDEVIVDMLTSGDMIGEDAVFEHGIHMSSAQAITHTTLLGLPLAMLREQVRRDQALAFNTLAYMSRHYRRHCDELALHATQTAPQRVGHFLMKLCPRGKKGAVSFDLPYDKCLIASTLGMKGETFSRALNALKRMAGVHISGMRVGIDSTEQLIKFVYDPASSPSSFCPLAVPRTKPEISRVF